MITAKIAELRRELRAWVQALIARMFLYTLTAVASSIGNADAVESADPGRDPDAPDDEKKSQRKLVRVQPFGFNSVPPKGIRGLSIWMSKSNGWFIGIGPTKSYGMQNCAQGETELYCSANGTRVYLDKNGVVHVDASTGQDVIVNGGSAQVGRVGDAVSVATTMATWIAAVSTALNTAGPVIGAPGTVTPPSDFGKISAGAAHFKA
jgi:phage gp45-like